MQIADQAAAMERETNLICHMEWPPKEKQYRRDGENI